MGSGVSRRKSKKVELQTLPRHNTSTVSDVNDFVTLPAEQVKKTTEQNMETPSAVQNQPDFEKSLTEAEKNVNVLKTHLSDGDLASEEVVSCCVELLKFSCTVDEIETAAVSFVLEKNIPALIFEIYGALLAKYPDVTKYDREKGKVQVSLSDKTLMTLA